MKRRGEKSDEPSGLRQCPVGAGNSGPHGGHAALWGGRVIRAGTLISCSSAFATPKLVTDALYYNFALYDN